MIEGRLEGGVILAHEPDGLAERRAPRGSWVPREITASLHVLDRAQDVLAVFPPRNPRQIFPELLVHRLAIHRGSILVRARSQQAQTARTGRRRLIQQERKTQALWYRAAADGRFVVEPPPLINSTSHGVVIKLDTALVELGRPHPNVELVRLSAQRRRAHRTRGRNEQGVPLPQEARQWHLGKNLTGPNRRTCRG